MLCLAHAFTDREFKVKLLKYKGQEVLFSERFSQYENLHFEYVDDSKSLIKGADVVISCVTYFADDICPDDCFDEGVLVVPLRAKPRHHYHVRTALLFN